MYFTVCYKNSDEKIINQYNFNVKKDKTIYDQIIDNEINIINDLKKEGKLGAEIKTKILKNEIYVEINKCDKYKINDIKIINMHFSTNLSDNTSLSIIKENINEDIASEKNIKNTIKNIINRFKEIFSYVEYIRHVNIINKENKTIDIHIFVNIYKTNNIELFEINTNNKILSNFLIKKIKNIKITSYNKLEMLIAKIEYLFHKQLRNLKTKIDLEYIIKKNIINFILFVNPFYFNISTTQVVYLDHININQENNSLLNIILLNLSYGLNNHNKLILSTSSNFDLKYINFTNCFNLNLNIIRKIKFYYASLNNINYIANFRIIHNYNLFINKNILIEPKIDMFFNINPIIKSIYTSNYLNLEQILDLTKKIIFNFFNLSFGVKMKYIDIKNKNNLQISISGPKVNNNKKDLHLIDNNCLSNKLKIKINLLEKYKILFNLLTTYSKIKQKSNVINNSINNNYLNISFENNIFFIAFALIKRLDALNYITESNFFINKIIHQFSFALKINLKKYLIYIGFNIVPKYKILSNEYNTSIISSEIWPLIKFKYIGKEKEND